MTDFGRRAVGETDHGELDGLADDDHAQYHNNTRGDLRYPPLVDSFVHYVFVDMYKQIITGSWLMITTPNQPHCVYTRNITHDLNDEIEFEIYAEAGDKTLEILSYTATTAAIITVYLDGVSLGTIDLYSNPPVWKVRHTLSATVLTTGIHSVKLKATSKNALSTNHYVYVTWIRLK